MKNKKCVLILPYFGKFNNYFPLFLKSCGSNAEYDWLIFTDCKEQFDYPINVHVIETTLQKVKKLAEKKFGFDVCLKNAYKFCDYKPAYGFLFEEYIDQYEYWGHCDCDLIFGKLGEFLNSLFELQYDKIFAAGHLTLYRNDYENNRRFMKEYNGHVLYREAFTTDSIYVLDEDMTESNVHRLFLKDGAKVFQTDMSMNVSTTAHRIRRTYYDPDLHTFVIEPYRKSRYFWNNGHIIECNFDGNEVNRTEYLYIHLQMRTMHVKGDIQSSNIIEIMPDRFVERKYLPETKKEMRLYSIGFTYRRRCDELLKKIKRNIKKIGKSV